MEKLNITKIKSIKNSLKREGKLELKKNEDEKEVKASLTDNHIYYEELQEDKIIKISGDEINGYLKKENKVNSNIEYRSEFYPNGNLRSSGQVEFISKQKERPFGTWNTYDNKENLIETTQYNYDDSLYNYDEDDLRNFIEEKYLNVKGQNYEILKSPETIINGRVHNKAWWIVEIYEGLSKRRVVVDAQNGNILNDTLTKIQK